MSTLAPGRVAAPARRRNLLAGARRTVVQWATPDAAITLGVAFTLAGLAFYAEGGVAIESKTYSEVLLLLGGGTLGAAALAAPTRFAPVRRLHGGWALGLFGALALMTALSIVWSLDPAGSWLEANRTLSYLAVFGGGLALARLLPGRWAALLHGLALACVVVCGYALATKVFPEWLAETELYARLRAPFGYWNSVGLMAATGVPVLLWLAARRSGHAAVNALAYPGLGVLFVVLMLSYSRGSLLALGAGLVVWFALVPLRLRSVVALAVPAVVSAGVVAWAFAQDGLTQDRLDLVLRADAGHELGVLVALMVVVLLAAGLAVGFAASARPPGPRVRELAGRALAGALVLALLGGVIALAAAPGGIDGQISQRWNQLTDPAASTPANSPDRLTATSSVRARYWSEAFDVHARSELVGAGAGAYGTARKRFRTGVLEVQHAHGYVVQTLADLGWIGLAISLAALAAWLAAAVRAVGLRRRDRGLPWDAERVGLTALAVVVVVFGVHSLIDWTWFIPANAVAALLCAGWVAGRGPLRERLATEGPTGVLPAAERAGVIAPQPRWSARERLVRWRPAPYRSVLAIGVLVLAMAVTWTAVQPLRAVHAGDAAIARLQAGQIAAATEIARIGADRNPLSVEPWFELSAIRAAAGDQAGAEAALEEAVQIQPANAEAWRRLGRYRLSALGDAEGALQAFRAAYYLDPQSPYSQSDVLEATRATEPAAAPPAAPAPAPAAAPAPTAAPIPSATPAAGGAAAPSVTP